MKNLTLGELKKAPTIIQYIFVASVKSYPISSKNIQEAIDDHPEYFPDEIEYKRKWEAVPQQVKDEYHKASGALLEDYFKSTKLKGLMHYIEHPEELFTQSDEEKRIIYEKKEIELYNHYFSPYELTK